MSTLADTADHHGDGGPDKSSSEAFGCLCVGEVVLMRVRLVSNTARVHDDPASATRSGMRSEEEEKGRMKTVHGKD